MLLNADVRLQIEENDVNYRLDAEDILVTGFFLDVEVDAIDEVEQASLVRVAEVGDLEVFDTVLEWELLGSNGLCSAVVTDAGVGKQLQVLDGVAKLWRDGNLLKEAWVAHKVRV